MVDSASFDDAISSSNDKEKRRLRKQLRQAKKLAKQLESLGLDENGNDVDQNFALSDYPVREWTFTFPGMPHETVALNPLVSLIGIVCLWGLVVWYTVNAVEAKAYLTNLRTATSFKFTWLLQITKPIYFCFMLYVAWKYGHVHLGNKDDKPEFSSLTYAIIIITAGISNGVLVYSVAEPLSHQHYHFFANAGYRSQDEVDMFAVNMTVTDWGFAGWAPYTVVAVAMSLATYRCGLPLIVRSCFYPILGHYTWGWIGDVIDGFVIVVTLFGTFTHLGFAALNVTSGFHFMGWVNDNASNEHTIAVQNSMVWIITIVSVFSVLSGLHGAYKILCLLAMATVVALTAIVFFLDDTKFLLNLQVQEIGYYLQYSLLQLNFWTDAFGQLPEGGGRAIDGKAAESWWMASWFNFFQAWWIVIAAGNGMFISSISRGRKVYEVILYSMMVPVAFGLIWFCIWGGVGLRQSRQASELQTLGIEYFNNSGHFLADGSEFCYNVPRDDVLFGEDVVFTNRMPGVSPVCQFDELNYYTASYHVLHSYRYPDGLSTVLSAIFMLACVLFYMTSAGAASFIVDKLASSGRQNNHLARRMFWLITVSALATTILSSAGTDAIGVLQAAMIVSGIPCAILLFVLMHCILLFGQSTVANLDRILEYQLPEQPQFGFPIYGGIFNCVEYLVSLGKVEAARVSLGMHQPTRPQLKEFFAGLIVPFASLHRVLTKTYPQSRRINAALSSAYASLFLGGVVGAIAASAIGSDSSGIAAIATVTFVAAGSVLAMVRCSFRHHHNIPGNVIADWVASVFMWPQVLAQMRLFDARDSGEVPE